MLQRKQVSNPLEIKILSLALYDDVFYLEFQKFYTPGLFTDYRIDRILEWNHSYFELYETVPKNHIFDIWEKEKENLQEDESKLYYRILQKAESEYSKGLQSKYILDKARELLQKKAVNNLVETVKDAPIEEAIQVIEDFSVPKDEKSFIQPFKEIDIVHEAFNKKTVPLFVFRGALGEMLNPQLTRDSFIGVMAPEKRGKSWWLFEFALRAFICRNNVVLFQVGDMSEDQGIRRLYHRFSGKPLHDYQLGECLFPVWDCEDNQSQECNLTFCQNSIKLLDHDDKIPLFEDASKKYKPCTMCKEKEHSFPKTTWFKRELLTEVLSDKDVDRISHNVDWQTRGREFRMSTHPNNTLTVSGINILLKQWKKEGWVPDVIVIDYADILASEGGFKEFRHGENEKWKALRKLSQVYNCLVVTATQTDAGSYKDEDITLMNYSEEKRKYSHVTCMLAINQSEKDKKSSVQRISTLLLRDGNFDPHKQILVLQALTIGAVIIDSEWIYHSDRNHQ